MRKPENIMKAIYICRSFAPLNNIASIRHSKLVKYLIRNGWQVTVFAEEIDEREITDPQLFCKELERAKIIYLPKVKNDNSGVSTTAIKTGLDDSGAITWKQSWFYRQAKVTWHFFQDIAYNLHFYQQFRCAIKKSKSDTDCDLIFSSYMPMGAHWSAGYLKRTRAKRAVWIADFRDLVNDGFQYPFFLRWVMSVFQASVCNRADRVTLISNGLRERITAQKLVRKDDSSFITMTNGYDSEDIETIQPEKNDPHILTISYAGQIIPNSRDASMLFEAIAELVQEQVTHLEKIKLVYAGPSKGYFSLCDQAKPFGMGGIITNQGYVQHTRALEIQKGSDLLLLLTSNSTNLTGIMTGKLMEYIGMDRPILALITGDAKGCEVSDLLNRLNIGSSFYYLDKENAKAALKACLVDYLNQKKKTGSVEHSPDKLGVTSYSYDRISKKLIAIYNNIRI